MSAIRMAAVAAPFDRDLGGDFERIAGLIDAARADGVQLLALPEACLGGYLADLNGRADGPPALERAVPTCQGFRATPPYIRDRPGGRDGRWGGRSGRQSVTFTSPGSTSSSPSKNLATSPKDRGAAWADAPE